MSDKNNKLEQYVVEKLKGLGFSARKTRGSGSATELGDVYNDLFYIECKQKHTKENIILDRKKDYLKLKQKISTNSQKEMFNVIENKFGERFVVIEAETFFRILEKGLYYD